MPLSTIAFTAAALLAWSLVSRRLDGTPVTPPLLFVALGLLAGAGGLGFAAYDIEHSAIHLIAEITLILVLFSDAARIDLNLVRRDHDLPIRMLLIGLPLAIGAGTLVAATIFPEFAFWEAVLLAALLVPTDAALGQAVVTAQSVPVRIRQAINIESGLNDGIALPAVLLCAALAGAGIGADAGEAGSWLRFGVLQVTIGPIVGALIGYGGARVLDSAAHRRWAATAAEGVGVLAVAVLAYVVAELIGGNGFISAFVAGFAFGNSVRSPCEYLFEFMESEGLLLTLITFLVFGAALLPEGLADLDVRFVVYGVLSLTIVRMIPVAMSLLGSGLRWPTYLFLGWFGPRGLASILFVLLILEETSLPHRNELLSITVITVALSVVLHGVTAGPLARAYGRLVAGLGECEESRSVAELPLREGFSSDSQDATDV